jgi:hypothetical protein
MRADAAARALENLGVTFGMSLEQDLRGVKARRALAQQRVAMLPSRPGVSGTDAVAAVRSRIQRHFTEFARGVEDRAQMTFHPNTGEIWPDLDERLMAIDTLEREKRAKTTGLRMGDDVESAWIADITERVSTHCFADLTAMRDMFRMLSADLERSFSAEGIVLAPPQFQTVSDDRLRRLLQQQCVLSRHFQSEVPRSGFFEYLMMARRYQMVLFMFISAFGLSFLRSYREFMIPAAVLLLSFGGLNVVNRVKKERIESTTKELEKAREHVRGETRRILTDVQRGWSSLVSQHLNDQAALVGVQLETAIRDAAGRTAEEQAQERQRVQRQIQSFEAAERKLAVPAKGRDTLMSAVAQLRGELRQLLVTTVRQPVKQGS